MIPGRKVFHISNLRQNGSMFLIFIAEAFFEKYWCVTERVTQESDFSRLVTWGGEWVERILKNVLFVYKNTLSYQLPTSYTHTWKDWCLNNAEFMTISSKIGKKVLLDDATIGLLEWNSRPKI